MSTTKTQISLKTVLYTRAAFSLTETFAVTLKKQQIFRSVVSVFGGVYRISQTILKLSFGTTRMAAYANKNYVCLFVTIIYEKVYCVDIIYLTLN